MNKNHRLASIGMGLLGLAALAACRSSNPAAPPVDVDAPSPDPRLPVSPNIEVLEETYPSGAVATRREGYYDDEGAFVVHGALTNFWENGQKKSELNLVHGVRHGARRAWYQNGQIWSEGQYVNGKEDGTWTVWTHDGRKIQEIPFDNGAYHGVFREWHENGQLKTEFTYVQGRKQGVLRRWDESGNVTEETTYVDDVAQP